ncbi:MAG: di-heme oxidoredictase family protein [Oligoflexales bacterium]
MWSFLQYLVLFVVFLAASCSNPTPQPRSTQQGQSIDPVVADYIRGQEDGDATGRLKKEKEKESQMQSQKDPSSSTVDIDGDVAAGSQEEICSEEALDLSQYGVYKNNPDTDGVLRTLGGGRVRIRHENEDLYGFFPNFYWEHRTFGFEVEDFSTVGDAKLRFIYDPVAQQAGDPLPNLRVFYTGDGNIFEVNVLMTPQNGVYVYEVTDNRIVDGAVVEFEFGIFLDQATIRAGDVGGIRAGDTNYYAATQRYVVGKGVLVTSNSIVGSPGGATTVRSLLKEPEMSYSQISMNLQGETVQEFVEGRALFHTNFVTGQHSERDKTFRPDRVAQYSQSAGPQMNASSCSECHVKNGRGNLSVNDRNALVSIVVKTEDDSIGKQLNSAGSNPEGEIIPGFEDVSVQLGDGTTVVLRKPKYKIQKPEGSDLVLKNPSFRVARQMVGMGLLEAIDDSYLLEVQRQQCSTGVSGRINVVNDPVTGRKRIGRFGWKAGKASILHQTAEALQLDMDVTTSVFPCPQSNPKCSTDPEMSDEDLKLMSTYVRSLGVPERRSESSEGKSLFTKLGCADCHRPTMHTGVTHGQKELQSQEIHPYTDLLLHNMGEDLADGLSEGVASGAEWRTPALWGVGLLSTVSGLEDMSLLHDGRARNVMEAILWHGGEASGAREAFKSLSASERQNLIDFVHSL